MPLPPPPARPACPRPAPDSPTPGTGAIPHRRLNWAFHIVALVQLRYNPLAKAYYAKKRAEDKTSREAVRCLKRHLVNVVYRLLKPSTGRSPIRAGLAEAAA